jgi:hypothetical protein
MKLYKTSYFKDIREIEVISFNKESFEVMDSVYRPDNKYFIKNDTVRTVKRFDSQNNYHETILDAKNFVLTQLSDKIIKMELDLIKYKSFVNKFS